VRIIVDGHNRHEICKANGIECPEVVKHFDNEADVMKWMILNQFGRRNISTYQRGVLALELEGLFAEDAKRRQIEAGEIGKMHGHEGGRGNKKDKPLPQNSAEGVIEEQKDVAKETRQHLAEVAGVSHDTISRVKAIQAKADDETKAKLQAGEMSVNEAYKAVKEREKKEQFIEKKQAFESLAVHVKNRPVALIGESSTILSSRPFEKVSLLLSDPPYGMDFKSGHVNKEKWDRIDNDEISDTISVLDKVFAAAKQHLLEDAHIYIFGNPYEIESIRPIFEKHFILKNILIWDREVIGMGDLRTYGRSYDVIYFGYYKTWKDLNGTRERDVLRFNRVSPGNLEHPTQKPLSILEYLIKKSTNPGEWVLDPFAGSFTTCEAAMNTGRNSYGVELKDKYLPSWMK
jgi:site-specific DNA-methyltransferase (adenine-specific)